MERGEREEKGEMRRMKGESGEESGKRKGRKEERKEKGEGETSGRKEVQ